MAYQPNNANGQATMANSSPVVIASDQSAVPISDNSGSITVDGSVTVSGTVTANAGTGTQNVSVQNASIPVTDNGGSLTVDGSVSISNFPATQAISGSVTVSQATASNLNANVTVQNASIPVTDNGGSLTVDGSVTVSGTVTIQDGGNTITVDGTVAATQSGTWVLSANSGVDIGDVTINNTQAERVYVQMTDGTNSIPVDTAHNDGESNTENHIDVAAKAMHYNGTTWDRLRGDTTGTNIQGNIAHDSADAGNPLKIGAKAIAHGTNPTGVTANDRTDLYANRAGVLFTIGGHPNIITRTVYISDATGAQTDASIVGTIAAGTKVAVTSVAVTVDSATTATGGVAVKLGFGATTIPADSSTGANGILLDHKGIAAGSGMVLGNGSGLLGIGADGEELRLTCEDPVGGGLSVTFSYYTIES
jgi:hypothetical protein